MLAKAFLPAATCFLVTILPRLFTTKSDLVKPLAVFALVPRKTTDFARLPLAILLTAFFFIARIAFMAFMAFIAFIALAIVMGWKERARKVLSLYDALSPH